MVGDEYYHWLETSDNQVVLLSDEGYYEYATILNNQVVPSGIRVSTPTKQLELQANEGIANKDQLMDVMMAKRAELIAHMDSIEQTEFLLTPSANTRSSSINSLTLGNQKVLCILVEFPDRRFTKSKAEFENMWNQTNYNVEGSRGSVNDFYVENSYGQMSVTATVIGPYMADYDSDYYATDGPTLVGSNVQDLVRDALIAARNDINFSDFDVNGDKYVDAVHIVYAGYAQETSSSSGLIWSHQSSLPISITEGAYKARDYFITSELAGTNGNAIAPIGTVCHEYAHILGAPDYYSQTYTGTGTWDLMCMGNWNGPFDNKGRYPADHNPYTKAYIFNWITPTLISPSVLNTLYTLVPSRNANSLYRINTNTTNEFFLLENNRSLMNTENNWINDTQWGLLIYHIHSDIENAIANKSINDSHPQECYVVCANATSNPTDAPSSYGGTGFDCLYPNSNKIFFTSNSTPSAISWAGNATGVDVCFIQRSGNNIKFVVNPQIEGDEILSMQSTYRVANIPAGATIKWTYTFVPAPPVPVNGVFAPIRFVNGNTADSVVVKRGILPGYEIIIDPIIPKDSMIMMGGEVSTNDFEPIYYTGIATLKATITSGGYSYTITKTITLSSDTTSGDNNDIDAVALAPAILDDAMNVPNNIVFPSYKLRYTNPISSNNAIIYIDKISEQNDTYIPCDENYTLEIWHDRLGLIKRIAGNTHDISLDCGNMPMGVYQMILIVNDRVAAKSKLLKL